MLKALSFVACILAMTLLSPSRAWGQTQSQDQAVAALIAACPNAVAMFRSWAASVNRPNSEAELQQMARYALGQSPAQWQNRIDNDGATLPRYSGQTRVNGEVNVCFARALLGGLPPAGAAAPTTTTAVAPAFRPPATTPTPPPQRGLTAAQQEAIRSAQAELDNSRYWLSACRDQGLGAFCAEVETQVATDQQRLSLITAQPSRPPPALADAQRRDRIEAEILNVTQCRAGAPLAFGYLEGAAVGRASPEEQERVRREREQAAREVQERERHLAACQPDMNAINGTSPPTATQASATTATAQVSVPDITPAWRSSLAQSTAAADARERDLRARSRRVHIGANDATDCMFVGTTLVNIEWGNEARLRMQNTCEYPVAVRWCANTQDCETDVGNLWTIRPGATWPIFFSDPENRDVRIGACRIGAQAAPIPGPSGVYTNGSVNERHLGPQTGSVSGVTEWDRNICSGG